jgi:DNA mismatch endonuclease, patch repair protein
MNTNPQSMARLLTQQQTGGRPINFYTGTNISLIALPTSVKWANSIDSGQTASNARRYKTRPVGPSPKSGSKAVSKSMKANRRSGTIPEISFSRLLRKKLTANSLPGQPDFIYRKSKVAVFIHGCFWHRCPVHSMALPKTHTAFWKRKFARNVERDRLNREELESTGWKVIEIWEHDVKANPRGCAKRVLTEVRERRTTLALDSVR